MENRLISEQDNISSQHGCDLPLSSNFHDVKVEHFVLDLSCSLTSQVFDGSITLFCKISRTNVADSKDPATLGGLTSQQVKVDDLAAHFFLCLDCFSLDITSCNLFTLAAESASLINIEHQTSLTLLKISHKYMNYYFQVYKCLKSTTQPVPLDFIVSEHFLKVSLPYNIDSRYPLVIQINYTTKAVGPSLMWTVDQCGSPCVFTVGHLMNNRSLFPSQDLPQAMSTWHCAITLTDQHMDLVSVIMTGEEKPELILNEKGQKVFNFSSSYPMPAATFALAVGTWSITDICKPSHLNGRDAIPHCRLFSPECLHEQSVVQLEAYLPLCFEVLNSVLGPYPLKHLDILVVPECFDSLGLACPHLMFVSQSLLCSDLSMFYRMSHELCHTWYGILTGPRDWTEEWLTEGVCCYLEDIVHAAVMKWDDTERSERLALRALLRFRTLVSEIGNTPEDLQTLRPNMGTVMDRGEIGGQQLFVKNGLDHQKTVMQVHYLKGYFLLRFLASIAGTDIFLQALKNFTSEHLGQLFSSKELLDYFFESCSNLRSSGLTVAQICQDWLDRPGMPDINIGNSCNKRSQVSLLKLASSRKRARGRSSRPQQDETETTRSRKLFPEQLVLMLDLLVEDNVPVTASQLQALRDTYNIQDANAEVKHSWCELVIHRKAVQWINDVKNFLLRDQALGVYLYGELLISENRRLQSLAYDCYSKVKESMPEGPRTIVQAMLFPT